MISVKLYKVAANGKYDYKTKMEFETLLSADNYATLIIFYGNSFDLAVIESEYGEIYGEYER